MALSMSAWLTVPEGVFDPPGVHPVRMSAVVNRPAPRATAVLDARVLMCLSFVMSEQSAMTAPYSSTRTREAHGSSEKVWWAAKRSAATALATACGAVTVAASELQLLMNQSRAPAVLRPEATVTVALLAHPAAIGSATSHRAMSAARAGFGTVPT